MFDIRSEQPADRTAIRNLLTAAFPSDLEARLVDQLRDAGRLLISLVAEKEGTIVGHVAFSPVTVPSGALGVGLAPVAVAETHRRQGIAASLIREGLDACRERNMGWAVVLGDPAYYARFGFRPAVEFGLIDEYQGGPAFQCLELIPLALPANAGLVRYAPEFALFA